ncbi:MAG: hydroxyethylthiazole kinase [Oscillospiraceae bacterium]
MITIPIKRIMSLVRVNSPLIHCITNPISINDCANAVLAVGAKPIMAEHPKEVAEITASSAALAVNLGNITDIRMEAMMISGYIARENHIPTVIDIVGVGCSKLRLDFAKKFISQRAPTVIKGNISEIKAICGYTANSLGIDVGVCDKINPKNIDRNLQMLKKLSEDAGAIIVVTGEIDYIVWKNTAYCVQNGVKMLSEITGTGCMLNVLIATFLSAGELLEASILATAMLGIAGELAVTEEGTGSFHVGLLNALNMMTDVQLQKKIQLEEISI